MEPTQTTSANEATWGGGGGGGGGQCILLEYRILTGVRDDREHTISSQSFLHLHLHFKSAKAPRQ